MEFSCFPMDQRVPESSIPVEDLEEYCNKFMLAFGLEQHISFNKQVVKVMRVNKQWHVKTGEWEVFDAVVVCTGKIYNLHHSLPTFLLGKLNTPAIPNINGNKSFKGLQIHSKFYRSPQSFDGQKVVVIGGGASAVEVANSLSLKAKKIFLSSYKNLVFLPKKVHGRPFDLYNTRFNLVWFRNQALTYYKSVRETQDRLFKKIGNTSLTSVTAVFTHTLIDNRTDQCISKQGDIQ